MLSKQDVPKVVTDCQPRFSFNRRENILRRSSDFTALFQDARRIDTPFFRLYWNQKTGERGRVAFAASKKVGKAVVRNRCKRRFYEVIRNNPFKVSKEYDMLFLVNRRSFYREFKDVEKAIITVMTQLKNR